MKRLYFFVVIVLLSNPIHAQLYINEFMASNSNTIADEFGEYDDWVEIFNNNDYSINLSGYYLTDDLENPTKWAFPDISVPGKDFILIWVDDNTLQGQLHVSFKLSADGEQIGLYNGINFTDSLTFGQQNTDISYGRYPDGENDWYFYTNPSPAASNNPPNPQFAEDPIFSPAGGFYSGSISVELTVSSPNATIRYTLDCSDPTEVSSPYTGPIVINSTKVVRARTYEDGYFPSRIVTYTYILNRDFDIATLSLVTDLPNLWDPDSGIYVNPEKRGDAWERPVSVEFYEENDSFGFSENAGFRIGGEYSRVYDKKSFRIYFRSEYGRSWLPYLMFASKDYIDEYKRIVVHSGSTDMPANPYGYGWTLIRDPLMHELGRRIDCIYTANRPSAVFLNGEPWGIYNLIERVDGYFTESNFGESDVDLIENGGGARVGDMTAWNEMISFFENHNLSLNSNYETAKTLIDINNFTNYNIIEIFAGNKDWPHHNLFAFRPRREGVVWRWILWDADGCFGPYGVSNNTLEWATRDDPSTLILRKLLENQNYIYLFINRFADLLNTTFLPANVNQLIDSLADVIRNDITFETNKWGSSPASWQEDGIDGELHDFANKRSDIVRGHIINKFFLGGPVTLTIETPQGGQGKVKVNSIEIDNYPWNGIYFEDVPIELQALPDPGYKFKQWSDPSLPDTDKVTISLINDYNIHVIFEEHIENYDIVINEINYNSAPDFDPEDWVELHNFSNEAIDVSGWHFKDSDDLHDFVLPPNTTIEAGGFLVLCRDATPFHNLFPLVTNFIGNFDFGITNSGELIRLYDASENLVDSLTYDDEAPWPTEPDGDGPTLELIDPTLDNALPESWQASENHGTPGQPNFNLFSISGNVCYFSNSNPVSQTLMSLTGHATKSTTTDSSGDYEIKALEGGDYKLIPGKENDVSKVITAYDAAWVLQQCVGLRTFAPYQMIAGDVTGNGDVSAYDAAYILQYGVDLINKFPIMPDTTHFWRFVPEDFAITPSNWTTAPDSIAYTPLNSDTTDNYVGIIYGDVTGNWQPSGIALASLGKSSAGAADIRFDDIYGAAGERMILPVILENGSDILAISFTLEYDARVLKALSAATTEITEGWQIAYNVRGDLIKVALAGSKPITNSGAIVNLEFEVLKAESHQANSPLNISEILINEGNISVNVHSAKFAKEAPLPKEYALSQNYPNPFNPETIIRYQVPQDCHVSLRIYNLMGQEIKALLDAPIEAGYHQIKWDGKDAFGKEVSSGIYLYILETDNVRITKKMIKMN